MSQFRITGAWPSTGPVDVPPISRESPVLDPESGLLSYPHEPVLGEQRLRGGAPFQPVADELVIRQVPHLDVADLHAVERFVAEHGAVHLDDPFDWSFGLDVDRRPSGRQRRDSVEWRYLFEWDPLLEWPNSWPSVAVRLAAVQRLSRHYLARARGDGSLDVWNHPGNRLRVRHQARADESFVEQLNSGLTTFHVRLIGSNAPGGVSVGQMQPDLVDVLHLQLWNLVVEGLPIRRCEFCGSEFVRQTGRAEHGQHRTSGELMYCSRRCARNSAQRSYRQRKRAEREG
jgi:hypothetical protein